MPGKQRRANDKSRLALSLAQGDSVAASARANQVPRSTAYRWARSPEVRKVVEACRHRMIERAVDILAGRASWAWAGDQIASIAIERRTGAGQTKSVPPDQRAGRDRPGPIPETRTSLGPDRGTIGNMGQTCNCVCRIAGGGKRTGGANIRLRSVATSFPSIAHHTGAPAEEAAQAGRRVRSTDRDRPDARSILDAAAWNPESGGGAPYKYEGAGGGAPANRGREGGAVQRIRGIGRLSAVQQLMSAAGGLWAGRRGIYLCPSLAARGAGQPAPRLRTATRARRKLGEKLSPSLISLS